MDKRKRIAAIAVATMGALAALVTAVVVLSQPRCCLTWANAKLWQIYGYYPGQTTRQVEDVIYTRCAAIGCQMQVGADCPSQFGVEQVAASLGLPGYTNLAQWDWGGVQQAVMQGRAIVFFWSGAGHTHPPTLMHAYACTAWEMGEDAKCATCGRWWCVDALNQAGRWWDETEVRPHWSGWAARWEP